MSGKKINIDNILNSLGGHKSPTDSDMWDSFLQAYNARKARKRRRILFWLFTSAVLAGSLILGLQYNNSVVNTASAPQTQKDSGSQTRSKQHLPSGINEEQFAENEAKESSVTIQAKPAGNTLSEPAETGKIRSSLPFPGRAASGEITDNTSEETDGGVMPATPGFKRLIQKPVRPEPLNIVIVPAPLLPVKNKDDNRFKPYPGWQLSINLTPSVTHNNYFVTPGQENRVHYRYADIIGQSTKNRVGLNGGVGMRYNWARTSLSSGVEYVSTGQRASYNYTISEVPVIDIDGRIAGYIQVNDSQAYRASARSSAVQNYIQVPLSFSYIIPVSQKFSMRFSVSGSLQYNTGSRGKLPGPQSMELGGVPEARKINTGMMFGTGMEMPLSKGFSMGIDFCYGWQLNAQYDKTALINNRVSTAALAFSLNYNLFSIIKRRR